MVPAQSTSKDLSQRGRRDLAAALHRVAVVLIGIYIILFINAVLLPNINDPKWASGILDSLRAVAFLPLIGGVLILLANHMDRRSPIINKHRNLAPDRDHLACFRHQLKRTAQWRSPQEPRVE